MVITLEGIKLDHFFRLGLLAGLRVVLDLGC